MKTWTGEVRLAPVALVVNKVKLIVAGQGAPDRYSILTPAQAMRLANQLRRWAMGKLRPRDEALPTKLEKE